ncbi:MAG: tRNA (N6-isopentenyl adenosine(37)-C2)-methylthiotransferase MiaB [Firmicutes bacterium]|nr:tRNA (N6-isopentenyl adenosine(37)-C2)-methylthiotransferase MiaB [Bacillota bacterium]
MKREHMGNAAEEALMQKAAIERMKNFLAGRHPSYYITTLGCQMNAHDSEKLAGILEEMGFVLSEQEEAADLVVYNTCCVRENAELKVYGRLGYLKSYKKKNPNMKIALCGCMMQEPHVIEKLKKSYRWVDLIFGTHNLYRFAELLESVYETPGQLIDIWDAPGEIVEDLPSIRKTSFKASVNIMFGCNNFCTYCIVPYVRGRERSREPEEIIKEIQCLAASGVKEIQLLGQNVNSYGKTLQNPISFAQLLYKVSEVEGIERIRFMTSHPKDLSPELIDAMKNCPKVCPHFHLPLQSGSDRLLKEMNRHYDKAKYLDIVRRLREAVPEMAITTDIIVGFPGETREDFLETVDVVRKAGFDNAFTFIYSKREGTPAARMENQVDPEEAKTNFEELLVVLKEVMDQRNERLVGKTLQVLVEDVNNHDASMLTGRSEGNYLVHFKGGSELIGQTVPVKIDEQLTYYLVGTL